MSTIIEPFPENIDRNYFGAWLSGFIDGEGSFILTCNYQAGRSYRQPAATFSINLRDDDVDVILLIQSYLQIGRVYPIKKRGNSQSKVAYMVFNLAECITLCKHFHLYPLIAKKKRDFIIWEKAVTTLDAIRRWNRSGLRPSTGSSKRWSEETLSIFDNLCNELAKTREYKQPDKMLRIIGKNA